MALREQFSMANGKIRKVNFYILAVRRAGRAMGGLRRMDAATENKRRRVLLGSRRRHSLVHIRPSAASMRRGSLSQTDNVSLMFHVT